MTFLAIYSESAHLVVAEKEIADGAKIKDSVGIAPGDEHLADLPLIDYDRDRYNLDARCRGSDWKVYEGSVAFSWDVVTQKVTKEVSE